MLENMKDARVIGGRGFEGYGERRVLVVPIEEDEARAALIVGHIHERAVDLIDSLSVSHGEALLVFVSFHYCLSLLIIRLARREWCGAAFCRCVYYII